MEGLRHAYQQRDPDERVHGKLNRPGFDGGSVTRNMRTWREETVTHGKRIEVLARAS